MIQNDGTGRFEAGAILIYLADRLRARGLPRLQGAGSATGDKTHPPQGHPVNTRPAVIPGGRQRLHGQTRKLKTSGD